MNWKHLAGYAFPPSNLVGRVLNKVILDETEIVLVAPVWQAQPLLAPTTRSAGAVSSSSTNLDESSDKPVRS